MAAGEGNYPGLHGPGKGESFAFLNSFSVWEFGTELEMCLTQNRCRMLSGKTFLRAASWKC